MYCSFLFFFGSYAIDGLLTTALAHGEHKVQRYNPFLTFLMCSAPPAYQSTALRSRCTDQRCLGQNNTLTVQTYSLKVSDKSHMNKIHLHPVLFFRKIPELFCQMMHKTTKPNPPALFYHPSTYLPGAWSPVCLPARSQPLQGSHQQGVPTSAPCRKVLSGAEGRAPGLPPTWGVWSKEPCYRGWTVVSAGGVKMPVGANSQVGMEVLRTMGSISSSFLVKENVIFGYFLVLFSIF